MQERNIKELIIREIIIQHWHSLSYLHVLAIGQQGLDICQFSFEEVHALLHHKGVLLGLMILLDPADDQTCDYQLCAELIDVERLTQHFLDCLCAEECLSQLDILPRTI